MAERKFNCFKCKHRGEVPGSCHISCKHPSIEEATSEEKVQTLLASVGRSPQVERECKDLNIKGNPQGIAGGWFHFPFNFDPTWLENCDGFEAKDLEEED